MIPNFLWVDEGKKIARGGQPVDGDWAFLKDAGITQVIKLNEPWEGLDDQGAALGLSLFNCPISLLQQVLTEPDKQSLIDVVGFIQPGTFIHCEHGQDRTGLVVAMYRVKSGWLKADAEKEMLDLHFHKMLLGLWLFWEDWVSPQQSNPAPTA